MATLWTHQRNSAALSNAKHSLSSTRAFPRFKSHATSEPAWTQSNSLYLHFSIVVCACVRLPPDDDGSEDNPLVYCDSCNVTVHAQCYGYPLSLAIPSAEWICAACQHAQYHALDRAQRPRCCLCPVEGGALKRTTLGEWCHLTCSQWIPEVFHRQPDGRHCCDTTYIAAHKYKRQCLFCAQTQGVTTDCSEANCSACYHVTCALQHRCYFNYQKARYGADSIITYCPQHKRKDKRRENNRTTQ